MREIKFRAYIEPDGEFPSGMFYGVWFDLTTVYIPEQNWSKLIHPPVLMSIGRECEGLHLEQFTGLKDKNGREIYEGDVLKYAGQKNVCTRAERDQPIRRVYWDDLRQGWATGFGLKIPDCALRGSEWEVIGTIHENPEMVE